MSTKSYPIPISVPVVAFGAGSHEEDEQLNYLTMPRDMTVYRPPALPEAEVFSQCLAAKAALAQALEALEAAAHEHAPSMATRRISLAGLSAADLAMINQVMGEGEVSVQVAADKPTNDGEGPSGPAWTAQIQESVFTGLWRVVLSQNGQILDDALEVGSMPQVVRDVARADGKHPPVPWRGPMPPRVDNAPSLLAELRDHLASWQVGDEPYVINLTLLPVTPEDIAFLDHELGTGSIVMLSRGYGNCRITNTCHNHGWRVVYYNSSDAVILNTIEVVDLPEVACATQDDLLDSAQRLREVLQWVE